MSDDLSLLLSDFDELLRCLLDGAWWAAFAERSVNVSGVVLLFERVELDDPLTGADFLARLQFVAREARELYGASRVRRGCGRQRKHWLELAVGGATVVVASAS